MDAKSSKILKSLTKMGGEQEVFDIAIVAKMDDDFVEKALEDMASDNLVVKRLDGNKAFWSVAAADTAMGKDKKSKSKIADDEFDLESAAVAAPPVAPAPILAATPIPDSDSAIDFEPKPKKEKPVKFDIDDDFEPKPKKEKPIKEKPDFDDFEPKPKKEKPVKEKPDFDDFEPKPKKEKPIKVKPDIDVSDDKRPDGASITVIPKKLAVIGGAAVIVLIVIVHFILGGSGVSQTKVKRIVEEAKTELADELKAFKEETAAKITKLEADNAALSKKVASLNNELAKQRPKPAQANTSARGGRGR